jgi:hypothetical protein
MGTGRTETSFSRTRIYKRPEVVFQQASEDLHITDDGKTVDGDKRGSKVAEFYRNLTTPPITEISSSDDDVIILDRQPGSTSDEICETCGLPLPSSAKLRRRHYASTAHLSKVVDERPPPLNPLPIDRKSFGYRVLNSQGWSDKERHGIGAEDNKGRREPVKTSRVKNDTVGLGIKERKDVEKTKSFEGAKEIRRGYERDKRIRKELLDHMCH